MYYRQLCKDLLVSQIMQFQHAKILCCHEFHEYVTEVLHELRLPREAEFPSHRQAEEAAFMLHERTGIMWQVQPLGTETADKGA